MNKCTLTACSLVKPLSFFFLRFLGTSKDCFNCLKSFIKFNLAVDKFSWAVVYGSNKFFLYQAICVSPSLPLDSVGYINPKKSSAE